jgi:hypothetical protein
MPLLPHSPCHERWTELAPTGEGRYCGRCDKTVIDLTRLTRREAERRVLAAGGALCGRVRVDPSGAPVFRPETARAPGLFGVAAAGLLAACGSTSEAEGSSAPATRVGLEDRGPSESAGGDRLLGSEASSGSLAGPMWPLDGERVVEVEAEAAGASVVAAVVEDGEGGSPTEAQRTLTEAKEEGRRPARRRRHTVADARDAEDPMPHAHGRRNGSRPVVSAPSSGPESPLNVGPTPLFMGGIAYTP